MSPVKILLVEDNEGDIVLTVDAFKEFRTPTDITIIRDGCAAMKFFDNQHIDAHLPQLILLDVNLPKVNGYEVLKNIRNNNRTRHIPVIMLTGSSSQIDVLHAYQNFANCYITKPFNAEDYSNIVATIETFWFSIVQLPKKT